MKQCILIISILLTCFLSLADETTSYSPRDYSPIPPSPQVASLMKYNETPVNYFTGVPDISVPIFTVQSGNLSIPIALKYHGTGIKVDDYETSVGLGWSLVAGGAISRTIYGHPDDAIKIHTGGKGLRGLLRQTANEKALREFVCATIADYDPSDCAFYDTHRKQLLSLGATYNDGEADMANDIFHINCMGLSGTFIYNDNKDLVLSSDKPFLISPNHIVTSYPNQFIVTDTKGTKYYFSKTESTKYEYYTGSPGSQMLDSLNYTSAWHLTKVKDIYNDSITFEYVNNGKQIKYGTSNQTLYEINNDLMSEYEPQFVAGRGRIEYYPQVLKRIVSDAVTVTFNYDSENGFLNDFLGSIVIKTNNEPSDIVKTFNLNYWTYPNTNENPDRNRRNLIEIHENDLKTHEFYYHGEQILSGTNSAYSYSLNDQDFCGYYNAAENTNLIPSYLDRYGGYSNRQPNPNTIMLGSLHSIVYPTGGKTEFVWESHEYGKIKDKLADSTYTTYVSSIVRDTLIGLTYAEKLLIDNFEVTNNTKVYLDLTNYFSFDHTLLYGSYFYGNHTFEIGFNYPTVVFINKLNNQQTASLTYYLDNNTINGRDDSNNILVPIEPGTYKVELRYPRNVPGGNAIEHIDREFYHTDASCGKIFIRREYYSNIGGAYRVAKGYWGGARISRILSYTHKDSIPIIKDYFYGNENSVESNGIAPMLPEYSSQYYIVRSKYETPGDEGGLMYGISSRGLYNVPIGGVTVEYPEVIERYSKLDRYDPDGSLFMLTLHNRYSSIKTPDYRDFNPTEFLDYQATGQQMWTSRAHHRGNLLNRFIGFVNNPVEGTEYEYHIYEPDEYSWFTTDLFRIADLHGKYDYSIGKYALIPYNKMIKSEKHIKDGATQTISYTYFYDEYTSNIDYGLVRSKRFTEADGSVKTIYYTYYSVNNMYLDVIETEVTVVNNVIVKAKRMEYYPGTNLLKAIYTLSEQGCETSIYTLGHKSASQQLLNIINDLEYGYKYDSMGNLAEIRYNGEVLASYLWGYRGLYPIVEIKNMSYDDLLAVVSSLGNSPENLTSGTGTLASNLQTFFSALRQALPNYEITTMKYHWLIGVAEAVDSRGICTHFSYDDWGRLTSVKDFNGYFIKKHDYHYTNEQ